MTATPPQPPYSQPQYTPQFGEPAPQKGSFLDTLGPRAVRRAEPRLSVVLAAAGCYLAVTGVMVIALDYLAGGDGGDFETIGDPNQLPGIILSALVVAAGYFLLHKFADTPLATAGVVAASLAVPPLFTFITFDKDSLPPFSMDAILGLSMLVWLASYVVGPGKGHPFFLGAGLIGAWLFILQLVENVFTFPFDFIASFSYGFEPGFDDGFGGDPFNTTSALPDPDTLGILTLLFAVGYAFVARRFDKTGKSGLATPFTVAALISAPIGILFLADTLGNFLTGLAFALLGIVYGVGGATAGRRFTTWVGGYGVLQGATFIIAELVGDSPSIMTVGLVFIIVGALIVVASYFVMTQFNEPPETTPGPSTFTKPSDQGPAAGHPQPPYAQQQYTPAPTGPDPTQQAFAPQPNQTAPNAGPPPGSFSS